MARYSLGFIGFGALTVSNAAGPAGIVMPTDTTRGIATPGASFVLGTQAGAVTALLVEEGDGPAADGSSSGPSPSPTARVAAGSGFGTLGQAVDLGPRLTVLADEVPVREVTFHVLGVGGVDVGLIGTEPPVPGLRYTILRATEPATEQKTIPSLRSFGHGGLTLPEIAGQTVLNWEAVFCFTHGTLIDTPDGPRQIDTLQPGTLVTTLHNGSQPLRWVGRRALGRGALVANPALRPILFETGTLGNTRPLLVSPQHRMLLGDWRAQVYFGEDEVLIAAKALENGQSVRQVIPAEGVVYCHLLFDRHEILVAEGALSESFHPGEDGLQSLDEAQRRELDLLFPGLELQRRRAAFPIVRQSEARALRLPG